MKSIKPLSPEEKKKVWGAPESNAGAGWWPQGQNHGPEDYDRPLGDRRGSLDPVPVDQLIDKGE